MERFCTCETGQSRNPRLRLENMGDINERESRIEGTQLRKTSEKSDGWGPVLVFFIPKIHCPPKCFAWRIVWQRSRFIAALVIRPRWGWVRRGGLIESDWKKGGKTCQRTYIPLSQINTYVFCPRRFYYESVEGHQVVNDHVEEGKIKHENVHTAVTDQKKGDKTVSRRQYLASDTLGVSGYTDLVEEKDGIPYPVEFKKAGTGKLA